MELKGPSALPGFQPFLIELFFKEWLAKCNPPPAILFSMSFLSYLTLTHIPLLFAWRLVHAYELPYSVKIPLMLVLRGEERTEKSRLNVVYVNEGKN